MSYFSHIIHELQVNGQTIDDNDDFNVGEDSGAAAESPSDTANNAAEETSNDTETTNDQNTDNDTDDDFTLDDADEEDANDTENDVQENQDDDQNDDFNISDDGENGTDENEEGSNEDNASNQNQNNVPEDPTDAIDDDEKRAAEEAIYDSLTDDQKRIRVLQLKIDYKDLYETIITTMEGINGIPKTIENLETIKRLMTFLTKAKNILIDYVENNFDSNTYLENYTMYIKYLAIFRTTAKVVEELNAVKDK